MVPLDYAKEFAGSRMGNGLESQFTLLIAFVIHCLDLVAHTYLDWRSGHQRFISSLV